MSPLVRIVFPLFTIMYCDCIAQSPAIIKALAKADSSRTIFYLPAHTLVGQMEWRDSIYMLPSFEMGEITLATGYSPKEKVRMNYNLYYMQMDYIDSRGDTLQIKPSRELRGAAIPLDRYYVQECDYFFIDKDNTAYKATFASASKLFREHKKAVKSYINENEIDFENREHLTKLLTFCNGLNR